MASAVKNMVETEYVMEEAMSNKTIRIGWSTTDITPPQPILMEGQMYMRYSQYVHDPIKATSLVFDNDEVQAIFVSLDMTEVPTHALPLIKKALAEKNIPTDAISYNVTHTHNSSSFSKDFMREDNKRVYDEDILPPFPAPENLMKEEDSQKFFVDKITALVCDAWNNRKPGGISTAHEYAAIGFNRRPQFGREEESIMYGDCSRDDFYKFESGTDTSVELLYTWDTEGKVTGVVCNVPCPSQVHELHCYLTADYWASARKAIKADLGNDVYVLSTCAAAGDLAPVDLVYLSKTNKQELLDWGGQTKEVKRNFDMEKLCDDIGDRIGEAVRRGYKTAVGKIDYTPEFEHKMLSMELPVRQVSEEDYKKAAAEVEEIHRKFSKENPMTMADLVKAFEPQGVVLRYRMQNENPMYAFNCHIIRLGNAGFATNPFELFHEYGFRIKARAKAEQVFIIQLSNDTGGYLPTKAAVEGGSYSSKPASTTCGPDGGDVLVRKTLETLDSMW